MVSIGDGVCIAQHFAHALGTLPQQLVANDVPEGVIYGFEAIQIEEQNGDS